ncbi:MAG: dockerin type I domain-containing protein [Candidatus Bathyarchaeia archaeon]|nr:PKD domain-containing protein [Candidatus Bathyarchaeota archaeon A05DMB-4]MDH7595562.1 PKD domain-containing protein [Candidatus Bathyarchaeota archaeon]
MSTIFVLEVSIEPSSVIMDAGQSQTFTSTVLGDSPPFSYQWYLDNTPISDAIDPTYTFTPSSEGVYTIHLNVTDSTFTTVQSNMVQVTVNPPLNVSISPSSVVMNVSQTQLFNSTVSGGTSPYSYQWYLNGAVVSGATLSNWTFTPSSSGSYMVYVNVTDSVGAEAKSNVASITVPKLLISTITDQHVYKLYFTPTLTVNVGGNLTLGGVPVSDGLVAVTIIQNSKTDPYIRPVLFRTLSTGTLSPQNWSFNIVSLQVGEIVGTGAFVPRTNFTRPSTQSQPGPAFNITVTNTNYKPLVYLTLTVFDANLVPITTRIMALQPVPANSTFSVITDSIYLGEWVALGNATAYVCAFDNVPPYIYFPYCPEASVQFQIVSSSGSGLSVQNNLEPFGDQTITSVNGNYNLIFGINFEMGLPLYSAWGNYTVKVSSRYKSQQAINSYVFWVKIPGDANGDGIVNVRDFNIVGLYWMQHVPPAEPCADLNGDGIVNIKDVNLVGIYWMVREQFT